MGPTVEATSARIKAYGPVNRRRERRRGQEKRAEMREDREGGGERRG